jgi:PAS domain S-box-containing protein
MTPSHHKSSQPSGLTPAKVVLLYALIAALWIIASGQLLTFVVENPVLRERIEIAKGLAFVAVTSGLLYLLLKEWRESIYADKTADGLTTVRTDDTRPLKTGRLALLFLAFALVIPLIGLVVTKLYSPQIERDAYANLQAVADLKAGQINHWLDERSGDALALSTDRDFAGRVDQFMLRQRDASLSKPVLDRLANLRIAYDYHSILLFNSSGKLLLVLGDEADNTPALQQQLRLAMSSRQVQRGDLFRDETGNIHLDWVVPIFSSSAQDARPVGSVVLRVTAQRFIFPLIQTWPTASASAETLLVRRDGESVLYLNELRHRKDTALTLRLPLSDPKLPATIAIVDAKRGTVRGLDYRGEEVLAAYRPVEKTNWHLIAKIDRDEVLAPLRLLAFLVSLVAAFAIAVVSAVVLMLWRSQRRTYTLELQADAMAAVKESELQYRTLADSGQALIWTADTDKLCNYFNKVWLDFTGRSLEQELGNGWAEGVHPDDFQQCLDGYVAAFDRREKFSMEYRLRSHDGEYRWLLDDGCPRYNSGGEFIGYIGYCLDITERKLAEESLHQLSQAVEQSPSAIAITDLKANIEYVNEGFVKVTGYSRAELVGQNPRILQSGKTPRENYDELWAHLTRGEVYKGEFINRRKDGSEYTESVLISPVRKTDGNVTHYLAIKEDITQFKQAQQALHTSREHFYRLLNSMAEGAYGVNTNGNCTFVNSAFLQMLGYQHESEVLGKHIHELIHHSRADGSPYPANECKAYCSFRHNRPTNVSDEVFWRKDGVAIPVEYWSHPIVSDAVATGSIVTFIDITERKRLELDREQYLKFFMLSINPMCIADPYGCFTQVNPAFVKLTGYSESELIAKPFLDFLLPEDRQRTEDEMKLQVEKRPTRYFDNRYQCKDGHVIDLSWTAYYDKHDGMSYATAIDITERKQAATKLAEQMEELHRWHDATSGREKRILELKHEMNELLSKHGLPPRYPSAESQDLSKTSPNQTGVS